MITPKISSTTFINPAQTEKTTGNDLLSGAGEKFADILQSLTQSQEQTDSLMAQLAAGEDIDIHTVMLAMEENDVNFRVAMAIRNKLVDAYREITHMSI